MTDRLEINIDLYREKSDEIIQVTVGHVPGTPQDWWNPGSPSETWVINAVDESGKEVKLSDHEKDIAVARAVFDDLRKSIVREADIWDDDKPF